MSIIIVLAFLTSVFLCFDKAVKTMVPKTTLGEFVRNSLQMSSYLVKTCLVVAGIFTAIVFFGWIVFGLMVGFVVLAIIGLFFKAV